MSDEVNVEEFVPADLDAVLSGEPIPETEEVQAEEPTEEPQADDAESSEEAEEKTEEPVEESKEETTVPVSALTAVRAEKQELQRQLDEAKKEPEAKIDLFDDPEGALENLKTEMRAEGDEKLLNAMMVLTKETVGDDFDEKVAIFNDAAAADNSLLVKVQQSSNPILAAYKEGKRLEAFKEIGDDPAAYKESLKSELMAEIKAELKAEAEQAGADRTAKDKALQDKLPTDIANENSRGGRGTEFTGPTPLDQILKD